jgi:uncharacterized protein (TIGR00369 family)
MHHPLLPSGPNPFAAFGPSKATAEEINDFLEQSGMGSANRCAAVGGGWAIAYLVPGEGQLRPGNIISGPTVFGVCDAALFYACHTVNGIEAMTLTSEMSIRYLRPARGEAIWARADVVKAGRRAIVGSVTAFVDDPMKPVAIAQGTYAPPA